jgi:hypothetical protein
MSIVGPVGPVEFVDLCRPAKKVRLTAPSVEAAQVGPGQEAGAETCAVNVSVGKLSSL